jgi:uncharacterized protein
MGWVKGIRWSLVGLGVLCVASPATAQDATWVDIPVQMRDGVGLSTDIWLPAGDGSHPTILIRTPYHKSEALFRRYRLTRYLDRGYAVVLQDTRGQGKSGGRFDFYFAEAEDGYDSIEWIAAQGWSDGRVAMDGGSYLATVQWLAARLRPPALKCIVPTAPSGALFDELPYLGGAFRLNFALSWIPSRYGFSGSTDWEAVGRHRPLLTADLLVGGPYQLYRDWVTNSVLGEYWRPIHFTDSDFEKMDIPAFTVTGWFDGDLPGALFYWRGMADHSPSRDRQFLVIGPWTHAETYLGGGLATGLIRTAPHSILDIQALRLAFLDACFSERLDQFAFPRALVYVTGADQWRQLSAYPAPETDYRPLYLGGDGAGVGGEWGTLSWERPGKQGRDRYVFDPRDPVPSRSGATDHRSLEARQDVLVYTSEVLSDTVVAVGPVELKLFAATDALDTDFTVKLLDVRPDGTAVAISWLGGAIRTRYREGYDREVLLEPGAVEEYSIRTYDVGHAFLPGHRIRIHISSSDAPGINPNQNTGNPVATDIEWKEARQTILHGGPGTPSRLVLPVLPGDGPR